MEWTESLFGMVGRGIDTTFDGNGWRAIKDFKTPCRGATRFEDLRRAVGVGGMGQRLGG